MKLEISQDGMSATVLCMITFSTTINWFQGNQSVLFSDRKGDRSKSKTTEIPPMATRSKLRNKKRRRRRKTRKKRRRGRKGEEGGKTLWMLWAAQIKQFKIIGHYIFLSYFWEILSIFVFCFINLHLVFISWMISFYHSIDIWYRILYH